MIRCCGDCMFFQKSDGELGECRRYAPRPVNLRQDIDTADDVFFVWPATNEDDWCGEYLDKK